MKDSTSKAKWELERAAGDAVKAISAAAGEAVKAIASAALEARSVISTNASDAARVLLSKNADGSSDHDTQIRLVEAVGSLDKKFTEKFADLKTDIKNLSDGTAQRISNLEIEKLNVKDSYPVLYKADSERVHEDLERRLRVAEITLTKVVTWGTVAMLSLGIIEFLVSKFL